MAVPGFGSLIPPDGSQGRHRMCGIWRHVILG